MGLVRSCWEALHSAWIRCLLRLEQQGQWVWHAGAVAWEAMKNWRQQCRPRLLLRGLPALAAGLSAVTVGTVAFVESGGQTLTYHTLATSYLQDRQYAAARVAAERLAALDAGNPEATCLLAMALMGDGKTEQGLRLLHQLAPRDRPGHAQAHLSLATHYLAQQPAPADLIEYHLHRVLELRPNGLQGHVLLGQFYFRSARYDQAEPHLRVAVGEVPELALPLATIYRARRQDELVQRWADQVIEHAERDLGKSLFNTQARLNLAKAHVLLDRHARAVAVLQQGLPLGDAALLRFELATVYLAWADTLPNQLSQQVPLFERGLIHAPHHRALLRRVWEAAQRGGLDALPAQGPAVPTTHLLRALEAARQGEAEAVRQHLRVACVGQPVMAVAACNLASSLAHDDPAEPGNALILIDAVVALHPRDARFRQARGRMFLKQANWQAARDDFEVALAQLPDDAALHRAAAQVYQQLGIMEKAAEHWRRAGAPPASKTPPKK